VRLDGGTALRQLLVEPLAAADRLGVQLGLHARPLLRLLLEHPLRPGTGLAELVLRVGAHLVGLVLGGAQHLLGVDRDVAVGRAQRQRAPHLVQLGAQHLDLVAEVVSVVDGLVPLLLQPFHLGFELREVVVSLVGVVVPHCAVPSVPWSW
jgi:hypothetical protein